MDGFFVYFYEDIGQIFRKFIGVITSLFDFLWSLINFPGRMEIIDRHHENFTTLDWILLLLANLISYAVMLLLTWMVFRRGFNYLMIHGDTRFFLMFSCLPIIYYVYMLASVNLDFSAFSSVRGYIVRLIPSIEVLAFYFLIPYIYESLREKILMQSAQDALTQELSSAQTQIDLLNETNTQTAVYRHDMRHQLVMLDGLLTSGETRQAQEYLKTVITDLDTITPKRFCENQTVNLLCSSYESKAKRQGVELKINAVLPKEMPLSDTELCSLISNGLENALHAASSPEVREKWVDVYCNIKQNKVFIQIQNPYAGDVTIKDGRPVSQREDHGFGCYSIQTITQRINGLCSFEAKDGLFTLCLAFLLPEETDATV